MTRRLAVLCFCVLGIFFPISRLGAAESRFIPLSMPQGDSENRTGMWFCPDLGEGKEILPLKTRVWATKESVTGRGALKCVFDKDSRGIITHENTKAFPAGSAGLTFYVKASRRLKLQVAGVNKLDIPSPGRTYRTAATGLLIRRLLPVGLH